MSDDYSARENSDASTFMFGIPQNNDFVSPNLTRSIFDDFNTLSRNEPKQVPIPQPRIITPGNPLGLLPGQEPDEDDPIVKRFREDSMAKHAQAVLELERQQFQFKEQRDQESLFSGNLSFNSEQFTSFDQLARSIPDEIPLPPPPPVNVHIPPMAGALLHPSPQPVTLVSSYPRQVMLPTPSLPSVPSIGGPAVIPNFNTLNPLTFTNDSGEPPSSTTSSVTGASLCTDTTTTVTTTTTTTTTTITTTSNLLNNLPTTVSSTEIIDSGTDGTSNPETTTIPPKIPSPSLDIIKPHLATESSVIENLHTDKSREHPKRPSSSTNQLNSNRIQKQQSAMSSYASRLDVLSMIELQKKYREIEDLVARNRVRRDSVERTLNDLARDARGKNIELDPEFRSMKEEQRKCGKYATEYKLRMDQIKSKLLSKFNTNIEPMRRSSNTALKTQKRAKMSTAAPTPQLDSEKQETNKLNRLVLDLRDGYLWCKDCDEHYDTIVSFTEHLHKSEHSRKSKRVRPWNKHGYAVDTRKTYNLIKSICAKVSNEMKQDFTTIDLDYALNGRLKDVSLLKNRSLAREREKFEKDDTLFNLRGYDHLIPIRGFYCQLCSIALCDTKETEQHLKSHGHVYAHTKNILLNPEHEVNFRAKLHKSRVTLSITESHTNPMKDVHGESTSKSIAAVVQKPSDVPKAPSQYKKKTSHIVDQHEVCKDKLEVNILPAEAPRPGSKVRSDDQTTKSAEHVDDTTRSRRDVMPEIVPLGDRLRSQPAALKRLKSTSGAVEKPPRRMSFSSNEDNIDDEQHHEVEGNKDMMVLDGREERDVAQVVDNDDGDVSDLDCELLDHDVECPPECCLPKGHPDSPFPELDLFITGNTHVDCLKDKRLKSNRVVLNRINLDDYKHMLMSSSDLWSRVYRMAMKKETERLREERDIRYSTRQEYFDASLKPVPIDLEEGPTV